MINDEKSRQQWAEETYKDLKIDRLDFGARKKHGNKKLEKALDAVEYAGIKVYKDFRDVKFVSIIILLVTIFMNFIFSVFFFERISMLLKVSIILLWIIIAVAIFIILYYLFIKPYNKNIKLVYIKKENMQINSFNNTINFTWLRVMN